MSRKRPHTQNLVDVGRREGGLRREGICRYFLCSIYLSIFVFICFVFLPTPTGHTRRPVTTVYGSKRVFPRKVIAFGGLDDKNNVWGSKLPKTWFWGAWIGILSQICKSFELRYLKKYALDQHEICRGTSGAQIDFVGGPALQNYNLRWRKPPSWIFAQTSITQPPIDAYEWNFAVM